MGEVTPPPSWPPHSAPLTTPPTLCPSLVHPLSRHAHEGPPLPQPPLPSPLLYYQSALRPPSPTYLYGTKECTPLLFYTLCSPPPVLQNVHHSCTTQVLPPSCTTHCAPPPVLQNVPPHPSPCAPPPCPLPLPAHTLFASRVVPPPDSPRA